MAAVTKQNGNAPVATAQRARYAPTALDFFPDLIGVGRLLDAMSSPATGSDIVAPAFPAVDISEQDGNYVIEAAVPGFRKEDMAIEVTANQVTISGQREEQQEDRKRRYSEIRRAAFTRTLVLPRDVNPESAKATVENGVLKIVLQPTSPIGAKKIPIETH